MGDQELPIERIGVIKTSIGDLWLEDGVICLEFDKEEITVQDLKEHFDLLNPLAEEGGVGFPVLMDLGNMVRMDREAREYAAANLDPKWNQKLAAVYHSPVQRVLASFFLGLNRVVMPLLIASSREEAVEWLKREDEEGSAADDCPPAGTDERILAIENAIFSIASGDFGVRLLSSPSEDEIDSLACGISMLAEEMGAMMEARQRIEDELNVYREHLEELVDGRTSELLEVNELLQVEIADRKRALEDLRRINAELDGFARTVSHDLKAPITGIGLAGEMIVRLLDGERDDDTDGNVRHSAELIRNNVMRAGELLDDILALAEAGQKPGEVEKIEILAVVEKVLNEREIEIFEKGASVQVDADLGSIQASPVHVYQVFTNLIGNALKHSVSSSPVIEVRCLGEEADGGRRYLVRDNGQGIRPEELDDIFLPFFKGGHGGDTGVGLSIVDKVVKVYGGTVAAYNDRGACIEFTLKDYQVQSEG
jgi:signal transduction histidine kinase